MNMMKLVLITLYVIARLSGYLNYEKYTNPTIPVLVQLLQNKMAVLVKINGIQAESELIFKLMDHMNSPEYQSLALFRNPNVAKFVEGGKRKEIIKKGEEEFILAPEEWVWKSKK